MEVAAPRDGLEAPWLPPALVQGAIGPLPPCFVFVISVYISRGMFVSCLGFVRHLSLVVRLLSQHFRPCGSTRESVVSEFLRLVSRHV